MEFVVDTNINFSYFWRTSLIRKVLMSQELKLFSPELSLEEINKYKTEIMRKTKITSDEFKEMRFNLALAVHFVPVDNYKEFLNQAIKISPDPNDTDFIALALKMNLPLWSNDAQLKKQKEVQVFSTNDLLDKLYKAIFPDKTP